MKIRIRGNSIRFRLTRGDVDTFEKTGSVEETIHFGDALGGPLLANPESENPLRILVEKDFKCLQVRKDEDESDAFPNPKGKEEPDASI